ncbi:MAG: uroporphyrinogen decarboxylase family protein [Defluviitaleaceae bacterium]|nr:uroporphyrinogen decarboxylase family protein [Defluviitaleaceae bacterium]
MEDALYQSYMGRGPKRIPHYEHWSNPDAESYITGIDYYDHPRECRLKFNSMYPQDLPVPPTDEPRKRPELGAPGGPSTDGEKARVRWGDSMTSTYIHGEAFFRDADEVFAFSPLKHADFTDWPHVVENADYSSEEIIYERYRKRYPAEWGDKAPEGSSVGAGFYNTTFMWPLLTFGWELFLECCLDPRFERIMDEFAEINRRLFRAIARLPVNFVVCHDDIMTTRGPVCSPKWMNRYVFPRYEEFWGILKQTGKRVIYMADGNMDAHADDVVACGATGIVSEPFTDWKAIAKKHKDLFIAGEGDNRVLQRNVPEEIKAMVRGMAETGKMSGGYVMCVGNHIPWNVSPEGCKRYYDYSAEFAYR